MSWQDEDHFLLKELCGEIKRIADHLCPTQEEELTPEPGKEIHLHWKGEEYCTPEWLRAKIREISEQTKYEKDGDMFMKPNITNRTIRMLLWSLRAALDKLEGYDNG